VTVIWFFNLMVIFMLEGFATSQDWEKFNSSLLIEVTRPKGVFTCTGVALTPTILATAAHCLEGEIQKVRVFTGSSYDPKNPSFAVKEFKIHPGYQPKKSAYRNDIARIILEDKLPDSIKIYQVFEPGPVTGKIYRFGFGARNKKNIRTAITPTYRRLNIDEEVLELDDTFSRSGDSGGPIYIENGDDIKVIAVHSTFSHGPEGRYSFNPLLAQYKNFLFPN
jgi:V8-like Glu-specific endopeptidase